MPAVGSVAWWSLSYDMTIPPNNRLVASLDGMLAFMYLFLFLARWCVRFINSWHEYALGSLQLLLGAVATCVSGCKPLRT